MYTLAVVFGVSPVITRELTTTVELDLYFAMDNVIRSTEIY